MATLPPRKPSRSRLAFMGTTPARDARGAHAAIFAAPHGTPYRGSDNRIHEKSADSYRKALQEDSTWLEHWDFDFDGPLIPNKNVKAVDLGNLSTKSKEGAANRKKIEAATKSILNHGAVPIMFGGDDSVPIPFLQAFAGGPAITVVQIDAHIDWRDTRENERNGFSSTMRRASEMEHVWRIVQVGARGLGSAREQEINDAQNWGAHLVPARKFFAEGIASVVSHIEPDSLCVICLDLDVLDSSTMPAVAYPSPGGLSFLQVTDLIAAIAAKATIGGFAMVEFVPKRDLNGTATFTAARIASHVLARVLRQAKT
jgi:agmatinase